MAKKKPAPAPVESSRHKDRRKNIPTEELRDFVAEDEQAPRTMLYPRDPSLDPQLVWKGKDEPAMMSDTLDLLVSGQNRTPTVRLDQGVRACGVPKMARTQVLARVLFGASSGCAT